MYEVSWFTSAQVWGNPWIKKKYEPTEIPDVGGPADTTQLKGEVSCSQCAVILAAAVASCQNTIADCGRFVHPCRLEWIGQSMAFSPSVCLASLRLTWRAHMFFSVLFAIEKQRSSNF